MSGEATADHKSPSMTGNDKQNRTRRLRLSCAECRNKKISCDRNLPCGRCVRAGRPAQCSFETTMPNGLKQNSDQIRELRDEVAKLKLLLSKAEEKEEKEERESPHVSSTSSLPDPDPDPEPGHLGPAYEADHHEQSSALDPKERSPRGYYRQHTLFRFFDEIPQLFPLIKETIDEWFKPRGVSLGKGKLMKHAPYPDPDTSLENLLPPKDDTDTLVSLYLNHFEQLHRVVHIPTFKREYANFWAPDRPRRYPAMTALVLAMISISTGASMTCSDSTGIASAHWAMPPYWISACDEWLGQQSSKAHKLVYYQVCCLVYLAKRMNNFGKKRFWNETGSLIQNAILDKLYCDPSLSLDSPYMREMKRRIWAVLRELDLQNSLEYELPTLLHNLDSNVAAPVHLDDEEFDATSKEIPASKPSSQYTCASYQYHSSRSWSLRLEISRRMCSTGFSKALNYDDVLRYTHEITQALDSLPSWTAKEASGRSGRKDPFLVSAFLQFQLKEYILAIHRPYLHQRGNRFSLSEIVCYHAARDMLLLNRELAVLGTPSLTLLREDLLMASLSLTRITMLQPRDSTSFIMASSDSTIDLLEQCLPIIEDRYLRCFYGEPWCPLTMCGAIILLKIHLGKESRHTAKSFCAQRFLGLHYQHSARQQPSLLAQYPTTPGAVANIGTAPIPDITSFPVSGWLENRYPNLGIDAFDLEMELDWDDTWDSPWPPFPNQPVMPEKMFGAHIGPSVAADML